MKSLGRWARRSALALGGLLTALVSAGGCIYEGERTTGTYEMRVGLTLQNGDPLPGPDGLTCLDLRGINPDCQDGYFFKMSVEAIDVNGQRDTSFNRFVRVSMLPGTVVSVTSPPEGEGVGEAEGRNVRLVDGVASEITVHVTGAFGPTRLTVEDIGYEPGDPTNTENPPSCADGIDNDGNGFIDYPADPGCAYSNDNSEAPATFAAGVSPPINFVYPKIADVQGCPSAAALAAGRCTGTPFAQEGVSIETRPELGANVFVARVSSSGMYVVDTTPVLDADGNIIDYVAKPYGSLYVFNFGLPAGVVVCDRVTQLTGTMDEFFGYTEMGFPSYEIEPYDPRVTARTPLKTCWLPEPFIITADKLANLASTSRNKSIADSNLEPYEAGLARVRNAHIPGHFGPDFPGETASTANPATDPCPGSPKFDFAPKPTYLEDGVTIDPDAPLGQGRSNCDFNRDGKLDFSDGSREGYCVCSCYYKDVECSEWSAYAGRSNLRLVVDTKDPAQSLQVNIAAAGFDAADLSAKANAASTASNIVHRKLLSVTGTLANFSGGNLNWTLETRCDEDVVLCPDTDGGANDGDSLSDITCDDDPKAGLSARSSCIGLRTGAEEDPGALN